MLLRNLPFVLLVCAKIVVASTANSTTNNVTHKLDVDAINKKLGVLGETRRKSRHISTSSSSGHARKTGGSDSGATLDMSSSSSSSSSQAVGKKVKGGHRYKPVSSADRKGWRKWHRKCVRCPEEHLKWRDPSINWICGAYQRARRSFKSACMMYYRNCQDGTMFVKVADHRCPDDRPNELPHGDHFFYEYHVKLSAESDVSSESSSHLPSDNSDYS